MGAIRFQYLPLDDKGGKGTSKSATGDEDADGFDFVSVTSDTDEVWSTYLVLQQEETTAAGIVHLDPDMLVSSYSTGGAGRSDVDDPTTYPDDWLG